MKRYIRANDYDDYYRIVRNRFDYISYLGEDGWNEGPVRQFSESDAAAKIRRLEEEDIKDGYECNVCSYDIEKIDTSEITDLYEVVCDAGYNQWVITYGTLEKCSQFLEDAYLNPYMYRENIVKNYEPGKVLEIYNKIDRGTSKTFIRKVGE